MLPHCGGLEGQMATVGEREERVLRVEEDLSTSLPLSANTISHETQLPPFKISLH